MDTVTAVGVLSSAIGGVAGALGERAIAVAAGCIPLGVWLAVRLTTAEGRGSAWRDALSAVNAGASRAGGGRRRRLSTRESIEMQSL
jgi:hypothetical protein